MWKKDESEPIAEDEYLLRRVYKDKFRTHKVPLISPKAFEPRVGGRDPDTNGISLYRELCQDSATDVFGSMDESKRAMNGIVRVPVRKLKELGLTILSDKDELYGIAGHVVIPELNSSDYPTKKALFDPKLLALAEEASRDENILVEPSA